VSESNRSRPVLTLALLLALGGAVWSRLNNADDEVDELENIAAQHGHIIRLESLVHVDGRFEGIISDVVVRVSTDKQLEDACSGLMQAGSPRVRGVTLSSPDGKLVAECGEG
jgi:hypothetical protein